ncbi:1899_t:CDS:2 [Paraglomus occultum]|uniref:1899_t:CDS:1 n=1 Tax=Paraglomus occultum TaxID=144539 RepID=A0A9N9G4S1_9GLOM|nr:1899_t:CDS:2 [Paraglomus occultum]
MYKFPVFLLVLLIVLIFTTSSTPQILASQPHLDHCLFTYKKRFYIYSGSNLRYIQTPFSVNTLNWAPISAKKIDQPACFVTTPEGILDVTDRANGSSFRALDLNKEQTPLWHTENYKVDTEYLSAKPIDVPTSEGKQVFIFKGVQPGNDSIDNSVWKAISKGNETNPPNRQFTFAQLADSDVFITYYGNDSIAAFNTTQRAWVTEVNDVSDAANDLFFVVAPTPTPTPIIFTSGPPNEPANGTTDEPASGPPNEPASGPTNDSTNDNGSKTNPGPKSLPKIIPGVIGIIVVLAFTVLGLLHGRIKNEGKNEQLSIVETETSSQGNSLEICQSSTLEVSGHRNEHYSFLSDNTITMDDNSLIYQPKLEVDSLHIEHCSFLSDTTAVSISNFSTSPTSHGTGKLNSTPSPSLPFIDWLYTQYEVTTSTFTASSTSLILPSVPSGTKIFNKYKLSGMSTHGVNNAVRRAEDETVGENVAVKFFKKKDSFEREVVMLKHLRSEFVCALRDIFDISNPTDWKYVTVMDYYPMSLDNFIVSRTETMSKVCVKEVVESLAEAIQYVHDHRIVHLDIKPGNFVHEIGEFSNKWRLIDFEAARVDGEEDVDSTTLKYASPEIINAVTLRTSIKASKSMDMWSLGCTMYEACTGSPLFSNEEEASVKLSEAYNTKHLELPLHNVEDIQARHVLEKLLVIDPTKRTTVDNILKGAYLKGGPDSIQIYNLQSESVEEFLNILNENTSVAHSDVPERPLI